MKTCWRGRGGPWRPRRGGQSPLEPFLEAQSKYFEDDDNNRHEDNDDDDDNDDHGGSRREKAKVCWNHS